jgi:hypothetical protein
MEYNIIRIQFEDKFKNKTNLNKFINNIPKEYKISILFISYTDINDNYSIWYMIFPNKNIYPDLNWLSNEDKEIYNNALKH